MRIRILAALAGALVAAAGCAATRGPAGPRAFDFRTDTLAFANELEWEYRFQPDGSWTTEEREPPPTYSLHCFVVARSARQFFSHARFDPSLPVADEETYRRLVRRVVRASPRKPGREDERVVIPGYSDLRAFSAAHEELLKDEAGGAWQSYLQRGNWRMVLPFSRDGQESVAQRVIDSLGRDWPPVVHVVTFPSLALNHAVLIYEAQTGPDSIRFRAYDPNEPGAPITITFYRATRSFEFPRTRYFPGGPVHVYAVYRNLAF
jgi:hypothetical protein